MSEVRARCPKLVQGVRRLGMVSEVRARCPKLGHTTLYEYTKGNVGKATGINDVSKFH